MRDWRAPTVTSSTLPPNVLPGYTSPEDIQKDRERSQRDAALGKRASSVLRGDLGPVLKRWVQGSVVPVAERIRKAVTGLASGRPEEAEALLRSPVFGLFEAAPQRDLDPVYRWFLKGDNAEDLTLAVLGTAITMCAAEGAPQGLTHVLGQCGNAIRETAIGQFITQVQGAKAMMRVRKSGKASWSQGKSLDSVAGLLGGQVRGALLGMPEEDIPLRGKVVVTIKTQKGDDRHIELRPPEPGDWKLLEIARHVRGEKDANRTTWMSFAMMILCAAQAEAGWFDLTTVHKAHSLTPSKKQGGKHRRAAHGLVLSEAAHGHIKRDLDKWLRMGFLYEPMLIEPVDGDYLTVKHRPVAGGRGPMGIKTKADESAAWKVAGEVMAKTPWTVPQGTLQALKDSEYIRSLAMDEGETWGGHEDLILGAYSRASHGEFYHPIFMDFRGREYLRSNLVTYQGSDMQKALHVFPPNDRGNREYQPREFAATVMHAAACYGGPDKLDKGTWREREAWWLSSGVQAAQMAVHRGLWDSSALADILDVADEPLQLLTLLTLQAHHMGNFQGDRLACQIDGTCNGLQHLSALFRDETAAPFVNLSGSSLATRPSDIYAEVAARVLARLGTISEPWARRLRAAIKIDRKLCKKPVMVLPYGGTRGTIEDACLSAILDQKPAWEFWTMGINKPLARGVTPGEDYQDWVDGNYAAFSKRDLKDHPLLHLDAKRLGGVVYDCIGEILPKAMAAMQTFRDIAKAVGGRTLEWDTGFSTAEADSLWVTQAKAKADSSKLSLKGFHLPNTVRGLKLRNGRDEIDPLAHTSGIVANFIHSQDASHLARTMHDFGAPPAFPFGAPPAFPFGAIHDCFITRPSAMAALGDSTRRSFMVQYAMDPLSHPVVLHEGPGKKGEAFGSWYELAEACGASFPEDGTWEPREVLDSAWFFS